LATDARCARPCSFENSLRVRILIEKRTRPCPLIRIGSLVVRRMLGCSVDGVLSALGSAQLPPGDKADVVGDKAHATVREGDIDASRVMAAGSGTGGPWRFTADAGRRVRRVHVRSAAIRETGIRRTGTGGNAVRRAAVGRIPAAEERSTHVTVCLLADA